MKTLFCKLREIIRSIIYGAPVDGHAWVNDLEDAYVILRVDHCKTCGEEEISWRRV